MGAVSRGVLKQALANVEALQDDLEAHRFMADAATAQWKIRDAEIEGLRDVLQNIALAGMDPPCAGNDIAETRKFHQEQAWKFIAIAAAALRVKS